MNDTIPQKNGTSQTTAIHSQIMDVSAFSDNVDQWMYWIEAYNAWLENKRRLSGSLGTFKVYRTAWQQFFHWAQVKPWNVTPTLAQSWATWLAEKGKEIKDKSGAVIRREGLSPRSINLKISALSSFYNFVQENYNLWPMDRRNPFDAVKRTKITPYDQTTYPSVEEAKAILNAINTDCVPGRRDFALLFTVLITCRKASEILNLKWGDIQELTQGGFAFRYGCGSNCTKWAILPVKCYQAIVSYLEAANRLDQIQDDEYIFIALDPIRAKRLPLDKEVSPHQPLSQVTANNIFQKYARRLDIDREKAFIDRLRLTGVQLRIELIKENGGRVDLEEVVNLVGCNSVLIRQLYGTSILDAPADFSGPIAADALLLKKKHHLRQRKSAGQLHPVEVPLSNIAQEIAKLENQLAQLKTAVTV